MIKKLNMIINNLLKRIGTHNILNKLLFKLMTVVYGLFLFAM